MTMENLDLKSLEAVCYTATFLGTAISTPFKANKCVKVRGTCHDCR